ncbi:MAG TPA: head GIN domain-containing protein [Albitalea sp.]|uniref:head GIN domain-containing protein n=1 Tax=Piscinibacter sp. TaxID=1903157 RepID=UPI002ED09235
MNRRTWLAFALGGAAWRGAGAAALAAEARPVGGIDSVIWDATGELLIAQSTRERLIVEAEPAVLARIVSEVRQNRLHLRFGPGNIQTQHPIRFRLDVRALSLLETRGSGAVRIGPLATPALSLRLGGNDDLRLERLQAESVDTRMDGAGEVIIGAGRVDRQNVHIGGSGTYHAPGLDSRLTVAAIDGSGEIRVAASERLDARISGSGEVLYRGRPQVVRTVTGAGDVRPL